jgi:Domain of unknown function (DUF4405)
MSDEVSKITPGQTKIKLWMDVLIFVAFLVLMEPHSSGLTIHEWLALSMLAVITIHLLLSWDWITNISRRFLGRMGGQSRFNYILNWLLFIDGTLVMVSGVMISEAAIPSLGIHLPLGFAWRRLHDLSANIVLILLGVHTALHWSWIVNTFNRYLIQPIARLFPSKQKKDASS